MPRFAASLLLLVALPIGAATEPNPSLRQRELADTLLKLVNVGSASAQMVDGFFAAIEKQFIDRALAEGGDPEMLEEAKETFGEFRRRAARIDFDSILHEAHIRLYAKYFTEEQLADLIAFYSTPTGRKSIEVLPQLTMDAMEAGMQLVTPKIEEAMREAQLEQEKKRPWRRIMSDMRSVAVALEAYAADHDEYPSGDYAALEQVLTPEYISALPAKDVWGHPYAYVVSPDRKRYRLVSSGADSIFDWDSRRIVAGEDGQPALRYRDRLEDDLILADGEFVQLPIQAKPRTRD